MRKGSRSLVVCLTGAVLVAVGVGSASTPAGSAAPASFSARVDNPWYPLLPGLRYVYTGVKEGEAAREVMTVTRRTKIILGAPCVVVVDVLSIDGRVAERTTDWYTQDAEGNVWYFGERTAEYDRTGRVKSTEGTWQAGVDGAKPGIFMFAQPRLGRASRQEYYPGQAEDHFQVIGLFRTVAGRPGANALLTKEWTPLEPGVLDHKLYVRGIGTVSEQSVAGGAERLELVSVERPA